ncbi:hypothetical protein [Streptomyces specialis]|uniref:hypothetical protein n=1 Tax=Streptomyces specialis TaxID=498367 RepID=UPI00073EFC39|nr:hypothetical protein [Streptomyces specialis]
MRSSTGRRLGALALVPLFAITACGGSGTEDGADAAPLEPAAAAQRLDEVCPSTVVVQLQWQPQSDMGALFEMLGPGYTVDQDGNAVTGPLVAGGKDTGVRLTLRAGGPAIGFQSVTSQMYADDTIHLGLVHADQLIAASGEQRVVGVTPLLKHSPAMLMWDPEAHPGLSIDRISGTDASVVVSQDQFFPDWLVAQGYVTEGQLDPSYDGAPARFVGDSGIVQQGFANSEPYTYEEETPAWGKPVGYQLLKDVGYDIYASNLTVRADRLDELSPCLDKLVPVVQQAGADYITAPEATNERIVDIVSRDTSYTPYSIGEAAYSAELLRAEGLVANEDDGSIGTYDLARVREFVTELAPVIRDGGSDVPADITADDLFTDQFADRTIGLP